MIKHIVTWKLDEQYSPEEKSLIIKEIQSQLLNLNGKVESLKSINVYLNSEEAPGTNYDILLDSLFDSMAGLKAYASHAEHVKVVEYIKSIKLKRAAIDFVV